MARTNVVAQLDTDVHLLMALRQLLGGFLELPPARAVECTTEIALRRELVRALLPWSHPGEGVMKMLLQHGECLFK